MDTRELTRLTNQLERGLSRATKATRALERLIARSDEERVIMESVENEKAILEKVSADMYELEKAIARIYPVANTNQEYTLDKQKALHEINGGLKALESLENGLHQGNNRLVKTQLLKLMQGLLRLQKMFIEERDG